MVAYQSSTAFTGGNGTSISGVSKPTSTAVNDVLVAQLYIENAGESPTISSTGDTWTLVHSITNTGPTPDMHLHVWICVVANASSTIGVTWGGISFWRDFAVHRFTGVHTTTPQDATATENQGTSGTVTATGLTTATANAHLVMCSANFAGNTSASWSSPLTERDDSGNVAMASGDQASAGASGDKTATVTSTDWAAILLALRPDGAASAPTVVGAGTVAFTATNGATISPGLPTGWAENDIHVMIAHRSDNTAMTSLSGWTQLSAGNNTTAQVVEVWARRAVSGDTAPTVTFGSGTVVRGARIIGVRGVPTTTALADLPISRSDNAASATITFATLTPPQAANRLLALYAYEDDPTAASQITNWSTFTVSTSSLGSDMALGYADREWATANSATGALTSTASGGTFANSPNVGILLALSGEEAALERTVTGSQPAATGTLARVLAALRSLAGAQPTATGTLARVLSAPRAVAGSQPAASGTLTQVRGYARDVAGSQPAASGTLAYLRGYSRAPAGSQSTATGTLTRVLAALRSLAGSQPAASGTLTRVLAAARALAGSQPAASGTLTAQITVLRNVAGAQPTATGTLARVLGAVRALAGAQTAASGTLSRLAALARSVTGGQPAASGALTRSAGRTRATTGSQPAPSGTLARLYATTRLVAGSQPSGTGSLSKTGGYARAVGGTQPAASAGLTSAGGQPADMPGTVGSGVTLLAAAGVGRTVREVVGAGSTLRDTVGAGER